MKQIEGTHQMRKIKNVQFNDSQFEKKGYYYILLIKERLGPSVETRVPKITNTPNENLVVPKMRGLKNNIAKIIDQI